MNIKEKAKELCTCHHKCHDTTDCVVEDEALLLINQDKSNNFDVKSNNELVPNRNELPFVLTNDEKVSTKERSFVSSTKRIFQMLEMKKNGATYDEIGKAFNVSKQRVAQIIGDEVKGHFKLITPNVCIYPNLRKWMNDNRITKSELTRRFYGNTTPNNIVAVGNFLRGTTKAVTKKHIDKYIAITGLTYEQLFEEEK